MQKMKDSGIEWIGEIPEEWNIDKVKYRLIRNEPKNPGNTIVLSVYRDYGVIPKDSRNDNHNVTSEDTSKYKYVKKGQLVINKMKAWQGSLAISYYNGIVSPAYFIYDFRDKSYNKKFFHYLIRGCYKDEFKRISGGLREGQWDLSPVAFENTLIIIPPITEQQQIASYLDTRCAEIDATSEDIQKEINILEDYKKSVITEAVTKGLNPNVEMKDSGIFYLGLVNKNWSMTKVGYCCQKLCRAFESSDEALVCSNKGKVVPRGDNLVGLMTSEDNAMQGIHKGDIAIHGMDTWHGAIACSDYDGKITRVVHVCDAVGDNRFIVYWLQHLAFVGVYKLISNGVRGNTSDFRSWDKVADIYIPNPIEKEQQQIADYLDTRCSEIDALIADKKKQLELLADYKKSLIYEYVTGKKEVPLHE